MRPGGIEPPSSDYKSLALTIVLRALYNHIIMKGGVYMANFYVAIIVSCIVLIALSFAIMCFLSAAADICYIRTRNKLIDAEEAENDD